MSKRSWILLIFTIISGVAGTLMLPEVRTFLGLDSKPSFDLNGEWKLVNTIEKTSYSPHRNLVLGYRLFIKQAQRELTADGEKTWENGESLPPAGRTAIHLTGSIDGETLIATFVEDGALRETNGSVVWRIQKRGKRLTGTFKSTAANSSGTSIATKVP
jgi:hypothetical protein